jgi:superfamily II DNA/RNA helicase
LGLDGDKVNNFSQFNFLPELEKFLTENNFKKPTFVQEKVIPSFIQKESISVLAATGSGKTLSYGLPLFHLLKSNDDEIEMEEQYGAPRCIILLPTRELALQVYKVMKGIGHHCKLRIRKLTGSEKYSQMKRMEDEAYDVLVATPGRLMSGLEKKEVKLDLLETLVIDEADQLLDMGFSKDLKKLDLALAEQKFQLTLFSATWPPDFEQFVSKVFTGKKIKNIELGQGQIKKRTIETYNIHLTHHEKPSMLVQFIKQAPKGKGIMFVNRKEDIASIAEHLSENYPRRKFWTLHGGLSKQERLSAYKNFLEHGGLLLASDIAARGMDIKDLNWVLNYDLPFEAVYYVHRCGRSGRGDIKGKVYNFVAPKDRAIISKINKAIREQDALLLDSLQSGDSSASNKKKVSKKNTKASKKKTSRKSTLAGKKMAKRSPRYKRK